jgi:hypothetical protein
MYKPQIAEKVATITARPLNDAEEALTAVLAEHSTIRRCTPARAINLAIIRLCQGKDTDESQLPKMRGHSL